jgi:hypothetical protein
MLGDRRVSISSEQPGMRRLPRSLTNSYPAVRLYLDDAKEIFDLLQEHFERVTIEAEGYALPSLDSLSEIAKDKIRRLRLTGYIGFLPT